LGPLKKRECPSLQHPSSAVHHYEQQAKKMEEVTTKRRKVLYQVEEQKITRHYPVLKPVSLSGFQIAGDNTAKKYVLKV